MKVKGLAKNTATGAPLAGVKVVLAVGDRELAVLFSDKEGCFEHMEEKEYVGQKLNCRVEKEGFKSQDVSREIPQDEVQLDIELVPERVELMLTVHDGKKNPLEGVKITLGLNGEQIGTGFSGKNGLAKITVPRGWVKKTGKLKGELAGFEPSIKEIQIEEDTPIEIIMKKVVQRLEPNWKYWKWAFCVLLPIIIISYIISDTSRDVIKFYVLVGWGIALVTLIMASILPVASLRCSMVVLILHLSSSMIGVFRQALIGFRGRDITDILSRDFGPLILFLVLNIAFVVLLCRLKLLQRFFKSKKAPVP